MRFTILPLMALCVAFSPGANARADEIIKGKIYDPKPESKRPIFLYQNDRGTTGSLTFSRTRYLDLEEKTLVDENVLYENGKLKQYKYNQPQIDESGSIEIKDGKVFYHYLAQGKKSEDDEKFEPGMIVPDMIEPVILESWGKLMGGESIKIRILLLERQDSIGFKLYKDKERDYNGIAAVDIVMKPSSIFIAAVAPSFQITVEKEAPHHLLETIGRLPLRVPEVEPPKTRKDWRAIDARVVMEYGKASTPKLPPAVDTPAADSSAAAPAKH